MTNILVVDDEADLEPLLTGWFRRKIQQRTYAFQFARNGYEALDKLRSDATIDILLVDINMPEMDGLALLAELPALNPMLRAVMVSAYSDMTNIRTAMNRGAFDFVCKPIDFGDLELTINKTAQYVNELRESQQRKVIDELKSRFFDNITHEFRTPLTLILSPVERLLAQYTETDDLRRHLLTVERNAQRLLRLINQLLDLAKLEAGYLTLTPAPGDLGQLIGQTLQGFAPAAEARGLSLSYHNELPGTYWFDAERIEQIVYNLVSNALKFTLFGGVTVRVSPLSPTTDDGPTVRLEVADTGIGIIAEKLPYIFNRFYQVGSESGNRRLAGTGQTEPGTGIGLALINELTDLMSGTVAVTSTVRPPGTPTTAPDYGTQFTVDLPLPRAVGNDPLDGQRITSSGSRPIRPPDVPVAHLPGPATRPPDTADDGTGRPLVLVVEDNDDLRAFLHETLADQYRVLTAANGTDAWALIQAELPDVVVSDVMMPVMDGYELTQRLKASPDTNHIAVVLLTAKVTHNNRVEGLTYGADDYLTKPFHADELQLRLRNLVDRQRNLREHYHRELARPDGPAPMDTVADTFLRRVYAIIEAHLDDSSLSVDGLAGALSMSRKTLYRKVQSLTQLSPNELIRQYRLRQGADLLRAGHNVSETAYRVGFETAAYFGKCFKEAYGITPSEMLAQDLPKP